jgi:hypothetical protein
MPPAYFYRKSYGFQDKYECIKTIRIFTLCTHVLTCLFLRFVHILSVIEYNYYLIFMVLKLILEKQYVGLWNGFSWLRTGSSVKL